MPTISFTDLTPPACWPHTDCPTCQGGGDADGVDGACPTCGGDGGLGMCDGCRAHRDAWCAEFERQDREATPRQRAAWLLRQVLGLPGEG